MEKTSSAPSLDTLHPYGDFQEEESSDPQILKYGSDDEKASKKPNADIMKAFGMKQGATHTRIHQNQKRPVTISFLRTTSSRVR